MATPVAVPTAGLVNEGLPELDALLLLTSDDIASDLRLTLVPGIGFELSLSKNLGIFVNDNGFLATAAGANAEAETARKDVDVGVADFVDCAEDGVVPIHLVSKLGTVVEY